MSKVNFFEILREKHHGVAKLFASGLTPSEVARLTGTSEKQLCRQILDPAFRDLVSRYKGRSLNPSPYHAARHRAYDLAA